MALFFIIKLLKEFMAAALLPIQRKLIFYPEKLSRDYHFHFHSSFEEVSFHPEDNIVLNALWFKKNRPDGVILFFHGNAGSLSSWGQIGDSLSEYNYDVLIFDYRGYGKSTGEVTEENIFSDSEFIYKELEEKYGEDNIIIYGRSIGSAPASFLASKFKPKAVILETPFTNFTELAKTYFPFIPGSLLQFKFENDRYLKKYDGPIFIIHGTEDEVIPFAHSEKLSEILPAVKKFMKVPGGHHNDLESRIEHHKFLDQILS